MSDSAAFDVNNDAALSGVDGIRAELLQIAMAPSKGVNGMSAAEKYNAMAKAVVAWMHVRGEFYFVADRPEFSGGMYFDKVRKILQRIQADSFLAWLSDCLKINRAERAFTVIQAEVETESLTGRSAGIEPEAYWASRGGAIFLSNGPGEMARITAESVSIVDNGTDGVLFPADFVLKPWALTEPENPFESCSLFADMTTTCPHGKLLFQLWAMLLPSNQKTKPPLVTTGPVGSGKTRCLAGIFELYGIPSRISNISENGEDNFWVSVDAGGLFCMDNADIRTKWFMNTMEIVSTGGIVEKRKLYTDSATVFLRSRAWVGISSANPEFAAAPGLADRLLVVRLDRRNGYTAERKLSEEIAAARDSGLSWICYALRDALDDKEPVASGLNKRHPDWAELAMKVGRAIGCGDETAKALTAAEQDKALFNVENDAIGSTLLAACRQRVVSGTIGEVRETLKEFDSSIETYSAKKISKRLDKMWPHLVELLGARRDGGHDNKFCYLFKCLQEEGRGFGGCETLFSASTRN